MIFGSTRARTDKLVTERSVRMIRPSDFGFLVGYRGPFGEVTSLKNKNKISWAIGVRVQIGLFGYVNLG